MTQVTGAAEDHYDAWIVVIAFLYRVQMTEIDASICSHGHKMTYSYSLKKP